MYLSLTLLLLMHLCCGTELLTDYDCIHDSRESDFYEDSVTNIRGYYVAQWGSLLYRSPGTDQLTDGYWGGGPAFIPDSCDYDKDCYREWDWSSASNKLCRPNDGQTIGDANWDSLDETFFTSMLFYDFQFPHWENSNYMCPHCTASYLSYPISAVESSFTNPGKDLVCKADEYPGGACPCNYVYNTVNSADQLWGEDARCDRQFTFKRRQLPPNYVFATDQCTSHTAQSQTNGVAIPWYSDQWKGTDCSAYNKLLRRVHSYYQTHVTETPSNSRWWWIFECCPVMYSPRLQESAAGSDRFLNSIRFSYSKESSPKRVVAPTLFVRWWQNFLVFDPYSLPDSRTDLLFWERICPLNGALRNIAQNDDGSLSFTCVAISGTEGANRPVMISECAWTENLGEFKADYDGVCQKNDEDGVIRGMQSSLSIVSSDRSYKIYCCKIGKGSHTADTTSIKIKTDVAVGSETDAVLLLTLCWENKVYGGVLTPSGSDEWFTTDDVVQYKSCGNDRSLQISSVSENTVSITQVAVVNAGQQYTIHSFNVYESAKTEIATSTGADTILVGTAADASTDSVIHFPNDYLMGCVDDGCIGNVYPMEQEYLMTLILCPAFTMPEGEVPQIGVILFGLDGNLDKTVLNGPTFKEEIIGKGDIGRVININIEHYSGPEICISHLTLYDPQQTRTDYGKEFFGDGVILSDACAGRFRLLTGIQYVPCYMDVFTIESYAKSLYASIQIHSCSGTDSGIDAGNSALLSMVITGLSNQKKFVSTKPLSLATKVTWGPDSSRDYTLPIFGEFASIALVSITNNHNVDALCMDSVLINGAESYLSGFWVGTGIDHSPSQTLVAVRQWPICKTELTVRVSGESPLPTNPVAVATSACVNSGRLLSASCAVEQSFETYEEIQWEHEVGEEVTNEISMESATETTVHVERENAESKSQMNSLQVDVGTHAETSYDITDDWTVSGGGSLNIVNNNEWGSERSWSTTTGSSGTTSTSVASAQATSKLKSTTDGKVNGKTSTISCSGSIEVHPQQEVHFSLLFSREKSTLSTSTDIKMTKCSAYLGENANINDPNNYVYVYGVKGSLTVIKSTNCYVSFQQSTQITPDPEKLNCGKERAIATREWGTYVPQCNPNDQSMYSRCQCAIGDKWTEPTCGCVDPTTGNLQETAKAAVVPETDTFKWTHWCTLNCGEGSFTPPQSAKVPPAVVNWNKEPQNDNGIKLDGDWADVYLKYMMIITAMAITCAALKYATGCNGFKQCFSNRNAGFLFSKQNKYEFEAMAMEDSEVIENGLDNL